MPPTHISNYLTGSANGIISSSSRYVELPGMPNKEGGEFRQALDGSVETAGASLEMQERDVSGLNGRNSTSNFEGSQHAQNQLEQPKPALKRKRRGHKVEQAPTDNPFSPIIAQAKRKPMKPLGINGQSRICGQEKKINFPVPLTIMSIPSNHMQIQTATTTKAATTEVSHLSDSHPMELPSSTTLDHCKVSTMDVVVRGYPHISQTDQIAIRPSSSDQRQSRPASHFGISPSQPIANRSSWPDMSSQQHHSPNSHYKSRLQESADLNCFHPARSTHESSDTNSAVLSQVGSGHSDDFRLTNTHIVHSLKHANHDYVGSRSFYDSVHSSYDDTQKCNYSFPYATVGYDLTTSIPGDLYNGHTTMQPKQVAKEDLSFTGSQPSLDQSSLNTGRRSSPGSYVGASSNSKVRFGHQTRPSTESSTTRPGTRDPNRPTYTSESQPPTLIAARGQSPQRCSSTSYDYSHCSLSQPTLPCFEDFSPCDGTVPCEALSAHCSVPCDQDCDSEDCRSCDGSQICCEPCANPEQCASGDCDDPQCLDNPQSTACVAHHTPVFQSSSPSYDTGFVNLRDLELDCHWQTSGQQCDASVRSKEELKRHVQQQHILPQAHMPCQWNECFDDIGVDRLKDHVRQYHSPTARADSYFCQWGDCGQTLASEHEWNEHMKAIHFQMNCHWDSCTQAAASEMALKEHVELDHLTKEAARQSESTTPTSEEITTPKTAELTHLALREVHNDQGVSNLHALVREHKDHISQDSPLAEGNSGKKRCQWKLRDGICGHTFVNGNELQEHVETMHINELRQKRQAPHFCHWNRCRTTTAFSERSKLARHLYTHTKYMVGACQHCGKEFNNRNQLENHERTHTAERPFECTVCGKRTSNKAALTTHMRKHTGDKPLKCDRCSYTCGDPSNMSKHRRIHKEPGHRCPICDKAFTRLASLRRHVPTHSTQLEESKFASTART